MSIRPSILTVRLISNPISITAQNGVGSGRGSHYLKTHMAQPMTDLSRSGPFSLGEEPSDVELRLENQVFSDEILISQ